MRNRRRSQTEILKIAAIVRREAVMLVAWGDPGPAYGENLAGACGEASAVLARILGRRTATFEDGEFAGRGHPEGHCWVRLTDNGQIVDITATQFGRYRQIHIVRGNSKKYLTASRGPYALRKLRSWGDNKWQKLLYQNVVEIMKKMGLRIR